MPSLHYYFNNRQFPILVSENTQLVTPLTFPLHGALPEILASYQFFSCIDKKNEYNILDVGAQSGLYSLFAKYLPNSTFYSFEPFKQTFDLLNDNLRINNIQNVKTYNIGLSNKEEEKVLNTCISHNGLHTLGTNLTRFNDSKQIKINVDTIDHMFYDKNIPVHFIKIDTEGWELNILKGAINTINKYKPIIQLEWNLMNMKQCDVTENELLLFFNDQNYYEKSMVEEDKLFCPK